MRVSLSVDPERVAELQAAHVPSSVPEPKAPFQDWSVHSKNLPKIMACYWSFLVLGSHAGAFGAMLPHIEEHYDVSYTVLSLVFISPVVGATASALSINWIHQLWGQRGVAIINSIGHVIAYTIMALHSPYPVLIIAFLIAGFAGSVGDAGWNAYIGSMPDANQLLSFLHGFFGTGAVLSPLVASFMIVKRGLPWYYFYYFMLGLAGVEVLSLISCFWKSTGAAYQASLAQDGDDDDDDTKNKVTLKQVLLAPPFSRITWLCSCFMLGYVGVEISLGGWIVIFMTEVRKVSDWIGGMTATGFWLGITLGRFLLCFVTPLFGERLAISIYLLLIIALELVFWLVPNYLVSAIAVGLQGFLLGPLFPAAIVVMSRLLPRHLRVSAIGFAAAFGSIGATVLPFVVGAAAQAKGVQVLQPIILSILVTILCIWLGLLKSAKKS